MRIYFSAASQRGLVPKVPICSAEGDKEGSNMLRVGDSSDVQDVNTFFSSESGIFNAVGPEGEDMIVICPPGEPWFVRKSNYKPEADSPDQ
jgi:hypothetical protein